MLSSLLRPAGGRGGGNKEPAEHNGSLGRRSGPAAGVEGKHLAPGEQVVDVPTNEIDRQEQRPRCDDSAQAGERRAQHQQQQQRRRQRRRRRTSSPSGADTFRSARRATVPKADAELGQARPIAGVTASSETLGAKITSSSSLQTSSKRRKRRETSTDDDDDYDDDNDDNANNNARQTTSPLSKTCCHSGELNNCHNINRYNLLLLNNNNREFIIANNSGPKVTKQTATSPPPPPATGQANTSNARQRAVDAAPAATPAAAPPDTQTAPAERATSATHHNKTTDSNESHGKHVASPTVIMQTSDITLRSPNATMTTKSKTKQLKSIPNVLMVEKVSKMSNNNNNNHINYTQTNQNNARQQTSKSNSATSTTTTTRSYNNNNHHQNITITSLNPTQLNHNINLKSKQQPQRKQSAQEASRVTKHRSLSTCSSLASSSSASTTVTTTTTSTSGSSSPLLCPKLTAMQLVAGRQLESNASNGPTTTAKKGRARTRRSANKLPNDMDHLIGHPKPIIRVLQKPKTNPNHRVGPIEVACPPASFASSRPLHPTVSALLLSTASMTLRQKQQQLVDETNRSQDQQEQQASKFIQDSTYSCQPTKHFSSIKLYESRYPKPPPRPWLKSVLVDLKPPVASLTSDSTCLSSSDDGVSLDEGDDEEDDDEDDLQIYKNSNHNETTSKHQDFTVMSYNVLSDRMVNHERYPSSPELALDWLYRREIILKQLLEYKADIIALQELEMEQFDEYFRPKLLEFGDYYGLFEPKSRAKTMEFNMRKRVDGCAIFYKRRRFNLVARHLLEFSQIAMANARGSEAMLNRVMTKDNIGLACVLELMDDQQEEHNSSLQKHQQQQQRILVCNTHIHWDPEYCDVKLIQTIMLMNELECIGRHYSCTGERNHQTRPSKLASVARQRGPLLPLVLLGDFNSTPKSGVSCYLANGKINSLHKDFKNFKYTSCSNALAIHPMLKTTPTDTNHHIPVSRQRTNDGQPPTGDVNPTDLRRQSTPAWCFYSSSSSSSCSSSSSSSSTTSNSPISPASSSGSSMFAADSPREPEAKQVLHYQHAFELTSAYGKQTMPYTNYSTKFKEIIDYVYYSRDSLQLLGLLGPLDKKWLKGNKIKGLPQPYLPSDHLPLLVGLRLPGCTIKSTTATTQVSISPQTQLQQPLEALQQVPKRNKLSDSRQIHSMSKLYESNQSHGSYSAATKLKLKSKLGQVGAFCAGNSTGKQFYSNNNNNNPYRPRARSQDLPSINLTPLVGGPPGVSHHHKRPPAPAAPPGQVMARNKPPGCSLAYRQRPSQVWLNSSLKYTENWC